jgi:hypothetical protein
MRKHLAWLLLGVCALLKTEIINGKPRTSQHIASIMLRAG